MNPETTDLDWITERLADVPTPSADATDQARAALIAHLAAAPPLRDPRHHEGRRHHANRPSRRLYRRPVSLGLAAVATAAAAFAVVNVTSDGGHSAVASADAATIIAHARSALTAGPGEVQEWTLDANDGAHVTWAVDGSSPHDYVFTQRGAGLNMVTAAQNGMWEFYVATTNTIYRDVDSTRAGAGASPDGNLLQNIETNARTVIHHDTTIDGHIAEAVTGTYANGTTYELWVEPDHGDRPLRLAVSSAHGTPDVETWSGYRTVTAASSATSPALLTARYPTAKVETLGEKAYEAAADRTDSVRNG